MEYQLLLAGLAVSLGGALVVALADAFLSRLMLMHLDTLEVNLTKLVQAHQTGATPFAVDEVDLKRDRRENRARAFKMLGWLALATGFGLQLAACLTGSPD